MGEYQGISSIHGGFHAEIKKDVKPKPPKKDKCTHGNSVLSLRCSSKELANANTLPRVRWTR